MCKLVSDIGRWSFLDGYQIYGNVVWLSDENEASKYKLIDDNGEKIEININDFIVK